MTAWPPLRSIVRSPAWGALALVFAAASLAVLPAAPKLWFALLPYLQPNVTAWYVGAGLLVVAGLYAWAWSAGALRREASLAGLTAIFAAYVLLLYVWFGGKAPAKKFHLLQYGALAGITLQAVRFETGKVRGPLAAALFLFLVGTADETAQGFIPMRTFRWADMFSNYVGAGLGAAAWWIASPASPWRRARQAPLLVLLLLVTGIAGTSACRSAAPSLPSFRPNVLLVTVDSLRSDRVEWTPEGRTPNLAALASRGARFSSSFTVAPWTAPSLVSIFTGLYPPTHGVENRDDTTPRGLPTLPRLLASRGYTLANYGFFSEVSYYRNLGLPPQAVQGAEIVGAQALSAWLPTAPEPFFAWIHLVEPHLPYGAGGYEAAEAKVKGSTGLERAQVSATLPLAGGYSFAPGDRERLLALYDQDVVSMDRALGQVLSALKEKGLAERTIVVFTADHGEEILDHGWVGHASTSGEAKLTDELLRVPLVFAGPGIPAGRVSPALAQGVDVAPTLLSLVGLPSEEAMQGISLVPCLKGASGERRRVWFSTTPGGHLTPDDRKGERLQGVSDGTSIYAERSGGRAGTDGAAVPSVTAVPAVQPVTAATAATAATAVAAVVSPSGDAKLAPDLARWRRSQARARMTTISLYPGAARPAAEAVASWPETLELVGPLEGRRLGYLEAAATVRLEWKGPRHDEEPYWVEYEVGSGLLSVRGAFPVEAAFVAFGPFPKAFWNDIASHAPFRFRVLDPVARSRSPWRAFEMEKMGKPDKAPGS